MWRYVLKDQTWSWQREKESDDPGQEAVSAQFQRSPSHWFNLRYKLKCRRRKNDIYKHTYAYTCFIYTHSCHPAWVLETACSSKRSFRGNDFLKIQYTTNTHDFSFLSWNSITSHGNGQCIKVWKVHHCLNLKWTQVKNSLPFQGTAVHPASFPGAVVTFGAGNFLNALLPQSSTFKKQQYVPFL